MMKPNTSSEELFKKLVAEQIGFREAKPRRNNS